VRELTYAQLQWLLESKDVFDKGLPIKPILKKDVTETKSIAEEIYDKLSNDEDTDLLDQLKLPEDFTDVTQNFME
jgi:hypothetical protein